MVARFTRSDGASRKLGVAVVGLGYWGPNLVRALFEQSDVDVRYACDRAAERLDRLGRRYPSVRTTTSFADVLADTSVDAVFLATPVFTHFELARAALEAGKHVFVEKPLAASLVDAVALTHLADECGRTLMCGHTFLYSPAVRTVKRLIDRDELGDIHFISSSRVNLGLHQRDVSVIWDLAPHDFSILLYWMDQVPDWTSTVGRASIVPNIPDVAFIDLCFPSGTLAHVELSWLAPSKLRRTVVVGSKKMIVYDDTSTEPVRIFDSGVDYQDPETFGDFQLSYRTGDIVTPKLDSVEPLVAEIGDFLTAVRERDPLLAERDLARSVVGLIEASERSLHEEGRRVTLPRDLALAV
jgi:predicted dehydrogenase